MTKIHLLLALLSLTLITPGCIRFESTDPTTKTPTPKSESNDNGIKVTDDEPPAEGFKVKFETTKGDVVVQVETKLAPIGVKRFYNLVKCGYFDEARFFRVVPGFVVQFGLNANPEVTKAWDDNIIDDPVKVSNKRGTITFATAGPNTRTTQLFINFNDNSRLDSMGFSPFGKVIEGMEIVDKLESKYGETPDQKYVTDHGNEYLKSNFPDLDYIKNATILQDEKPVSKEPAAGEVKKEPAENKPGEEKKPLEEKKTEEKKTPDDKNQTDEKKPKEQPAQQDKKNENPMK